MEIIKEYTENGLKLTHPSGVISLVTLQELESQEIEFDKDEKVIGANLLELKILISELKDFIDG